MAAQIHVVLAAESNHHQTVHIPHGGKLQDLIRIFGFFHHHKLPVGFNFCGQGIQRRGNKNVIQRMSLIFFMVIDKYADDPRGILRQKDTRHAGNILPFLQQCLHTLCRFIRYFPGFPMYDIGYGRGAETQLFRDVADPHPFLFHTAVFLSSLPALTLQECVIGTAR